MEKCRCRWAALTVVGLLGCGMQLKSAELTPESRSEGLGKGREKGPVDGPGDGAGRANEGVSEGEEKGATEGDPRADATSTRAVVNPAEAALREAAALERLDRALDESLAEVDAIVREGREEALAVVLAERPRAGLPLRHRGGRPTLKSDSPRAEADTPASAGPTAPPRPRDREVARRAAAAEGARRDPSARPEPGSLIEQGTASEKDARPEVLHISGDDDDTVARQLRELAEKETDDAMRERLWEEYRRYKVALGNRRPRQGYEREEAK